MLCKVFYRNLKKAVVAETLQSLISRGKVKLGIKQENVTVFLEDGTEIDDDETFISLPTDVFTTSQRTITTGSGSLALGPCVEIPVSKPIIKVKVQVDPEKLRNDSKIYQNLESGSFLYKYRYALNEAAYQLALDDPSLVYRKGELQEKAKMKVDTEGYGYKRIKSREDLKEVELEMTLLERSRSKARNVNNDDRARHLTLEITPLRKRKRSLEEELTLLQKKEAKSIQQKKKKTNQNPIKPSSTPLCSSQRTIEVILKKSNNIQVSQKNECAVVVVSDETETVTGGDVRTGNEKSNTTTSKNGKAESIESHHDESSQSLHDESIMGEHDETTKNQQKPNAYQDVSENTQHDESCNRETDLSLSDASSGVQLNDAVMKNRHDPSTDNQAVSPQPCQQTNTFL
ncbi:DNA fragmentation factor subunit alpha-like [Paramuricea clavata]|uniref:DNAation factor subunit alpha-like n=1 Tax=Paramuricea clavata TaxID=317549 RepID=A0A7D9DWV8_PARCT|nr:DNA fragmentation factor subunit alpha-like [Paramuricea clavata]